MTTGRHIDIDGAANFVFVVPKQPAVKKSRRKFFLFLSLGLLAACSISAYLVAAWAPARQGGSPMFSVRKINIFGLEGANRDLVRQSLSAFLGSNLLELSSGDLEDSISGFGFVEGFLLKKQYPFEITVEIKQKPSIGFAAISGKFYELDGEGNFWESATIPGRAFDASPLCRPGDEHFQRLVRAMTEMRLHGYVVLVEPAAPDSFLLSTREGRKLKVFAEDFKGQWAKYLKSVDWLDKNVGNMGTIDLRWSGRVVFAPSAPEAAAAKETDNGKE